MNQHQRILAEYTRLIEGMYEKTNYGYRAISKQTYRGGFNAGLDASVDVLKIAIENSLREQVYPLLEVDAEVMKNGIAGKLIDIVPHTDTIRLNG